MEIINELLKNGSLMTGSFLAMMQREHAGVYSVSKQLIKERTDRFQEKEINGIHHISCVCNTCQDAKESKNFIWAV